MSAITKPFQDTLHYRSLLADIHSGKSSKYLRDTYGVDIRRNHAVLDRAKNAEAVLSSLDEGTLKGVLDVQEDFYQKYDLRRLKRLVNFEAIDTQLTETRNSLRRQFGKEYQSLLDYGKSFSLEERTYDLEMRKKKRMCQCCRQECGSLWCKQHGEKRGRLSCKVLPVLCRGSVNLDG